MLGYATWFLAHFLFVARNNQIINSYIQTASPHSFDIAYLFLLFFLLLLSGGFVRSCENVGFFRRTNGSRLEFFENSLQLDLEQNHLQIVFQNSKVLPSMSVYN